jgi:hypothetical protein
MRIRNQYVAFVVSALIGTALGLIGGPVYILIPWGLTGLAVGYISTRKKTALVNGAVYGFMACYFFMISGYEGKDPLVTKLLPFVAIGLFGAIFGLVLGILGNVIHKKN